MTDEATKAAASNSAEQPHHSSHRPIIVAVDDDPAVLSAVRGDLRRKYGQHYRIMVASGGPEAVDLLKELKLRDSPLALVVSDQRMPDVSGFEVLKVARELFSDVRTVLLTAYADTEVAIGAINDLHLDYYILKPWEPPEERLYPVLDDLLEDWHAGHQPTHDVTRVVGTRWSAPCESRRRDSRRGARAEDTLGCHRV